MFKKIILLILVMAMFGAAILAAGAEARELETVYLQEDIDSVVFPIGSNRFFINNKTPGYTMDVKTFVVPGYNRTVVPVRFLSNALGVADENIEWIQAEQKVILSQPGLPRVEMVVGQKFMIIDGNRVDTFGEGTHAKMDIAPRVEVVPDCPKGWGRTFLPARFVAYALGFEVSWCEVQRLVIIHPRGTETPPVANVRMALKVDTADRLNVFINGTVVEGQPLRFTDGEIMVPVTFIKENLEIGKNAGELDKTVVIMDGKEMVGLDFITETLGELSVLVGDNLYITDIIGERILTEVEYFNDPIYMETDGTDTRQPRIAYFNRDGENPLIIIEGDTVEISTLDTDFNSNINQQIRNVIKAFSSETSNIRVRCFALIEEKRGTVVGIYLGEPIFSFKFFERVGASNPQRSWEQEELPIAPHIRLDVSRLFSGELPADGTSIEPYWEDRLRASLVILFGEEIGLEVFHWAVEVYLARRAGSDFHSHAVATRVFGNIEVDQHHPRQHFLWFTFLN